MTQQSNKTVVDKAQALDSGSSSDVLDNLISRIGETINHVRGVQKPLIDSLNELGGYFGVSDDYHKAVESLNVDNMQLEGPLPAKYLQKIELANSFMEDLGNSISTLDNINRAVGELRNIVLGSKEKKS